MSIYNDKNKRALVIEDEPVIGRICKRTLTTEGYDVDIALNGSVAKDMADENVYDIYLSDIRTPEMNGIEFYEYLKNMHPELADRVIFTTGDILSTDVKQFLQEFKGIFLPKPFTPEELKKAIMEYQVSLVT